MNKQRRIRILIHKADKALSDYVRRGWSRHGKCPLCNIRPVQCCFHIISRRRKILRWSDRNVIGSCKACNYQEQYYPDLSRSWYIDTFGVDAYLDLVGESRKNFIPSEEYLKKVIKTYTNLNEQF